MMDPPIRHYRLCGGLLPKRYLLLLRKTRACAQREIRRTSFAREITFNGWMRTISCHETRLQSKRTLLSSAWGYFIFRVSKARFVPTSLWCDLSPIEWLQRRWEEHLHMNPATWLVTRELTDAAGRWDTRLLGGGTDDGEYFCRAILASDGIRFVQDARAFYRITGSSSLSYIGRSNKKMESLLLAMQLQIGHLRSVDDSERSRAACVNYIQGWLPNFYPGRPDIVKQLEQLASSLGG